MTNKKGTLKCKLKPATRNAKGNITHRRWGTVVINGIKAIE